MTDSSGTTIHVQPLILHVLSGCLARRHKHNRSSRQILSSMRKEEMDRCRWIIRTRDKQRLKLRQSRPRRGKEGRHEASAKVGPPWTNAWNKRCESCRQLLSSPFTLWLVILFRIIIYIPFIPLTIILALYSLPSRANFINNLYI